MQRLATYDQMCCEFCESDVNRDALCSLSNLKQKLSQYVMRMFLLVRYSRLAVRQKLCPKP